ncbi:hypothetical protein [Amycolatopsis sp. NPDC098790]|uniref:hypothetical protein n=1 Tax=Amycolatopsis sp. NPDC098790 TaxID=3363939 RepID=UPI00380A32C6
MTDEFSEQDETAGVGATRKMSLYRMYASDRLLDLAATKVVDDPDEKFAHHEVEVGGVPALLVAGESHAERSAGYRPSAP